MEVGIPQVLSKTSKSITFQLPVHQNFVKYKLAYSDYGYVYYSWTELEVHGTTFTITDLQPNTNYVAKVAVQYKKGDELTWSEYSPLTPYVRTFTEEEEWKRSGTYFEHAFKMEKEQTANLTEQISKLTKLLGDHGQDELDHSKVVVAQEDLFQIRKTQDAKITALQGELQSKAVTLASLQEQKVIQDQIIEDLLKEGEELRQNKHESDEWRAKAKINEKKLKEYQAKQQHGQLSIEEYKESLSSKKLELIEKEKEVERIMQDCRRVVQEHADSAQAQQLQMEEALNDAKTSLENQISTNQLLRDELKYINEQYRNLEDENRKLKTALEKH